MIDWRSPGLEGDAMWFIAIGDEHIITLPRPPIFTGKPFGGSLGTTLSALETGAVCRCIAELFSPSLHSAAGIIAVKYLQSPMVLSKGSLMKLTRRSPTCGSADLPSAVLAFLYRTLDPMANRAGTIACGVFLGPSLEARL